MSTDIETEVEDQIDAQLEDDPPEGVEVETPDGQVLMTPVEEEPDAADEVEEQADPKDDDAEIRIAIELKMKDLFAEQHTGRRLREVEEKAKSAHTAAKKACEVQDDRIKECIDELEALYLNEPDPAKFPLFDKAKAEINGMFAKPDSIQPLPPDTFEEALRRKQMNTTLASMGFKAATLRFLHEKLGVLSAWNLVRRINEESEQGRDFGISKGMTPLRFEEIAEALGKITDECQSEWDAAHPAEDQAAQPLETVPAADYLVVCNSCDYTRPKSEPGPCPNGHVSGFTLVIEFEVPSEDQGE